ncbi:molybdenum cofactor guanylyltransferase MobA [soil metagenome]
MSASDLTSRSSLSPVITKEMITGLVLAGGRGARMGHADKGLQSFRGAPLISHVLQRLAPQVGRLIINANRNLHEYEKYGHPVKPDAMHGFHGPLAGLQTGLQFCETPYLLSVPCDSPFLPDDLVARLSAALLADDAELAVAITNEDGRRQPHPVFCLTKVSLLPHLTAYLQSGGRKFDAWYAELHVAETLFEDAAAFRNLNNPRDFQLSEVD